MKNAAQRIMDLFASHSLVSGTHGMPDLDQNGLKWNIKKTAKTLKMPVTLDMWKQHLDGKRPLGLTPIMENDRCWWGSIDVDQYDIDLSEVIRRVETLKLPLVPCRSKSGGLHLFLFMCEPIEAEIMQNALRDIAASLGFAGSELFPKQIKTFADRGDMPSWMVMPYFGGDYGGKLKFQYGLKKTGAEQTLEEFLTFAEKKRVTEQDLEALRASKQSGHAKGNGKSAKSSVPFGNGPPCLEHMAAGGFPQGGRNNALFHIGVFHKKANPSDWKKRVEEDNQKFMKPPLNADEVKSVIRGLEKKDYEYKCKDQPMSSHCDSVKCRGRKFGVGTGGVYPVIESIKRLDSDPPLWFVDIPGGHLSMNTAELVNYRKFHMVCVDRASVVFKLIPDPVWMSVLHEAMQNVTVLPAPDDIGDSAVFREMLEEFLTNRTRGQRREDLLRGAPWEDEEKGRHYFRMMDLAKFMQRQGSKMNRQEMSSRIKDDYGGEQGQFKISGKANIRAWHVQSKYITPAPELDIPQEKEEDI